MRSTPLQVKPASCKSGFSQLPLLFEPALELSVVLNAAQIRRQSVGDVTVIGLKALQ
jgi:hypothetical protein